MPEGIWIIDRDGNTLYANDRMAAILGTTAPEMRGQPSFTYVFADDTAAAQQLFDRKKQGDSSSFRFRLRRKDGSAIVVNVQGTPLYDHRDDFVGIVGTFEVVSETGRLEGRHYDQ